MSDGGKISGSVLQERDKIVDAYSAFWDHARFKHGWMKPHLVKGDVMHLLQRAALIVARTREVLDERNPEFKIRAVDGAAQEFFWQYTGDPFKEDPRGDRFVRRLVHATFQDGEGYVEGLDREQVDAFIDHFGGGKSSWRTESSSSHPHLTDDMMETEQLYGEIRDKWTQTSRAVNGLLRSIDAEDPLYAADANRLQKFTAQALQEASAKESWQRRLRSILGALQQLETDVNEMQAERTEVMEKAKAAAAEVGNATPMRVEEVDGDEAEEWDSSEAVSQDESGDASEAEPMRVEDGVEQQQQAAVRAQESRNAEAVATLARISADIDTADDKLQRRLRLLSEWLAQEEKGTVSEERKQLSFHEKQVGELTHTFMTLLHELDALIGPENMRSERKAKVKFVNAALDRLEEAMGQLKTARSSLEKRAAAAKKKEENRIRIEREKEEERRREKEAQERAEAEERRRAAQKKREEEAEAAAAAQAQAQSKAPKARAEGGGSPAASDESDSDDEDNIWRQLRMKPRMDVREGRDRYEIVSHIPGMRRKDIKLTCANDVLTIEGFRQPTQQELLAMQRQAREHILRQRQQRMWGFGAADEEDERDLIMRLAAGRFGSFSEQFKLPAGEVDEDGINAHYDKGTLAVVVPKKKQAPQPRARAPAARRARGQYPSSATPFGPFGQSRDYQPRGFFDRDMFM